MQTGAAKVRSSSASPSRSPENRIRGLRPSRKRRVGVTSLPTYGPRWGNRFVYDGSASDQRYPGQYFDQESGLHYNYFRDYDPKTGRYIEPDPIGLKGGTNLFEYALMRLTVQWVRTKRQLHNSLHGRAKTPPLPPSLRS